MDDMNKSAYCSVELFEYESVLCGFCDLLAVKKNMPFCETL